MADLTTLANAKEYLKIPVADVTRDSLITNLVKRSTALIQKYCGRILYAADYTEYYDGAGEPKMNLRQWPINSVSVLNMDNNRLFGSSTLIPASQFVINNEFGYIELLKPLDYLSGIETAYGRFFVYGQQNIQVIYNAGYAIIPDDVEMASIIHVAWLYNKAGLDGHASISLGGLAKSFIQKAIPDEVAFYLEPYRKRSV